MRKELIICTIFGAIYLFIVYYLFGNHPQGGATGEKAVMAGLDGMERRLAQANRQIVELTSRVRKLQDALAQSQGSRNDDEDDEDDEDEAPVAGLSTGYSDRIPILMISCNRPDISRALDKVMQYRPKGNKFPIIVSQDCGDEATAKVVQKYDHDVIHLRQPNLGPVANIPPDMMRYENYYKISRHFKWALTEVFDALMFDQVIIIEDDLEIAPDFFNYFEATLPLLRSDPTLYCVSAWNDNGKMEFVSDPNTLYRSDFFPGLGWMITRELWTELDEKWPAGFWDDWLRHPSQRKDRSCIRPEISRTYTFGRVGVSQGQFFDQHLKYIVLNQEPIDFLSRDLSDLMKGTYDDLFEATVAAAELISLNQLVSIPEGAKSYKVEYRTRQEFESIAGRLGLMSDTKAGVPRGAYLGIVPIKFKKNAVYIVPTQPWAGYVE